VDCQFLCINRTVHNTFRTTHMDTCSISASANPDECELAQSLEGRNKSVISLRQFAFLHVIFIFLFFFHFFSIFFPPQIDSLFRNAKSINRIQSRRGGRTAQTRQINQLLRSLSGVLSAMYEHHALMPPTQRVKELVVCDG
jgi:hypothetical protein